MIVTFFSFLAIIPYKSSSCHLVCITISLPPGLIRVLTELRYSFHIVFLVVSESASCLFLIGSSIMNKSAVLPVKPDKIPRLMQRPFCVVSNSTFERGDSANVQLGNKMLLNSSIFSLFLLPNLIAKSSL